MAVSGRERHHRRSIRLRGYDYGRSGLYYVTLCTQDRACLFGEVVDGGMHVNHAGSMVSDVWCALPDRFPTVALDAFVIMPNHIHGVIVINDEATPINDKDVVGAGLVPALDVVPVNERATTRVAPTLGDVIGAYKSVGTVQYTRAVNTHGWMPFHRRLWQRNYYEHVIRNAESLSHIRRYILDNPQRWHEDRYNTNEREGTE